MPKYRHERRGLRADAAKILGDKIRAGEVTALVAGLEFDVFQYRPAVSTGLSGPHMQVRAHQGGPMPRFRVTATEEREFIDDVEAASVDEAKAVLLDRIRTGAAKPTVTGFSAVGAFRYRDRGER